MLCDEGVLRCELCPWRCEVCGMAWGQVVRQTGWEPVVGLSAETEGRRGGLARKPWICHSSFSMFALQWFSHLTCLLNQGPPLNESDNYAPMSCNPPILFHILSLCCFFYIPYQPCFILLPPVSSFALCDLSFQVLVKWENTVASLAFSQCLCNFCEQ